MTDDLTIQLRVLSTGVEKIRSAKGAVQSLNNSVKTASAKMNNFAKTMESTGSRVNVLGQRMTGMITLPLVFFANTAIKTALSIETAWTRFDKVFSGTADQMANLQEAGTELSEKFGIDVEDVAEVMGEFNKAGIESEDMLKSLTEQALETSILFDTDLMGAFDGVKAIMFGFGLSGKQTTEALAAINVVADSTTTSEQGILDVMQRSGAIFKQYGVGVTEAAALTSLLAQSNIKGSTAGMAFKTVLTKIGDATPKATRGMAKFGINVSGNAFRTATFSDKLRLLNEKQKEVFSSGNKGKIADWNTVMKDLTGIRQADRFSILVSKIGDLDGVIENAEDPIKNLKIWNEQLATVMDSSPHKFEIMNQIYRNQANILGKELLPYKMKLLKFLNGLIEKFNALSPKMKEWTLKILGVLAVAGPLLAFIGLTITGLGFLLGSLISIPLAFWLVGSAIAVLAIVWIKNWEMMKGKTLYYLAKIKTYIKEHWADIKGIFEGFWISIKSAFDAGWGVLKGAYETAMGLFKGDWSLAWDGVKKVISSVFVGDSGEGGIVGIVKGAMKTMESLVSLSTDAIVATAEKMSTQLQVILVTLGVFLAKWWLVRKQEMFIHMALMTKNWIVALGIWVKATLISFTTLGTAATVLRGLLTMLGWGIVISVVWAGYDYLMQQIKNANEAINSLEDSNEDFRKKSKEFASRLKDKDISQQEKDAIYSDWNAANAVQLEAAKTMNDALSENKPYDFVDNIDSYMEKFVEMITPVGSHANGGPVYASQGFAPKGNDTIPAMLSPGEMVLNKSQQGTLFNILSGKSQLAGAGGATVNINVAGNMIASRGEQREFVRQIEVLMTENANRS